jgi:proteic killer suppression protein
MIRSFKGALAADLFFDRQTMPTRRFPPFLRVVAQRKLQFLNAATSLLDLRSPPGNRLEALKGDLAGHHSIRINNQWRVVFRWDQGAHEVQVLDYH